MNLHEKAKRFIDEQPYKGAITEQGSTARQNFSRLIKAIDIFEQHGINTPTEADFDNILRPEVAAKGKTVGEQANEKTIQRTLGLAKKFYEWIKTKGDFQMNDSNIMNTEEEKAGFYPATSPTENNHQRATTAGRPPKTGRTGQNSKKISLYMTKETFNRLEALRIYDDAEMQDLLNEALEVYFKTREDDMKFLHDQEEARRARKANRTEESASN